MAAKQKIQIEPVLLAHSWNGKDDPTGWWVSEKLNGVRAYWNGEHFISRNGTVFFAPDWFKEGLPGNIHLDGELFMGRDGFQDISGVARRHNDAEAWRGVTYMVFDAPNVDGTFEQRMAVVEEIIINAPFANAVEQWVCKDKDTLLLALDSTVGQGGEGLMLRKPGSFYDRKRSKTLLKVKKFVDCEAKVIDIQEGRGRNIGRMGALICEMPDGEQFKVGTGFSDNQRDNPPKVGDVITVKYQNLTRRGVPMFPVFVGIRTDLDWGAATTKQSTLGDFL